MNAHPSLVSHDSFWVVPDTARINDWPMGDAINFGAQQSERMRSLVRFFNLSVYCHRFEA